MLLPRGRAPRGPPVPGTVGARPRGPARGGAVTEPADGPGGVGAVGVRGRPVPIDHGYLERVAVGGGRSSTRWRVVVEKLVPQPASRHNSSAVERRQTERRGTAQDHRPWFFRKM